MIVFGTPGDDPDLQGTPGKDDFDLTTGGSDTASGFSGNDVFSMGDELDAADHLDGGPGHDKVSLAGDYSAGLTFGPATIQSIEVLFLGPFNSYNLTLDDGNVAPGARLLIDGRALQTTDQLILDGSGVKGGNLTIFGGQGDDTLTGGSGNDVFYLQRGGSDTADGGSGKDIFKVRGNLDAADTIDGGAGRDAVWLKGDYSAGLTLAASTITNVEGLRFFGGFSYDLTLDDGNIGAGHRMVINAGALTSGDSLSLDGSGEADGFFLMFGGAGGDTLTGGSLADTIMGGGGDDLITGGGGADKLTGGAGTDTFVFTTGGDSSSTTHDTITDFAAGTDKIDVPTTITGVFTDSGSVSSASFDTSIQLMDAAHAGGATVITATDGDLIGHKYLLIDGDGNTNYNAGVDYIIEITGFTGTFTTGDFI